MARTTKDGQPRPRVRKRMEAGGSPPQATRGRPTGEAKKAGREIADAIATGKRVIAENEGTLPEDATPLDVMLMAMRAAYKLGGSLYAAPFAEKAAPYLHPKVTSIELRNPSETDVAEKNKRTPLLVEFVKSRAK